MKKLAIVSLLTFVGTVSAQTDNTFYAKQFPGTDVGAKVTNALAACNSSRVIQCYVVIDPSMGAYAPGTLPTPAANQNIIDFRTNPYGGGGSGGISTMMPGIVNNSSTLNDAKFTSAFNTSNQNYSLPVNAMGQGGGIAITGPITIHQSGAQLHGGGWGTANQAAATNIVVKGTGDAIGINCGTVCEPGPVIDNLNVMAPATSPGVGIHFVPDSGDTWAGDYAILDRVNVSGFEHALIIDSVSNVHIKDAVLTGNAPGTNSATDCIMCIQGGATNDIIADKLLINCGGTALNPSPAAAVSIAFGDMNKLHIGDVSGYCQNVAVVGNVSSTANVELWIGDPEQTVGALVIANNQSTATVHWKGTQSNPGPSTVSPLFVSNGSSRILIDNPPEYTPANATNVPALAALTTTTGGSANCSANTAYFVNAQGNNFNGHTANSNEVSITTPSTGGPFNIIVTWTAIPDSTYMAVSYGTSSGGEGAAGNAYGALTTSYTLTCASAPGTAPANTSTFQHPFASVTNSGAVEVGGAPPITSGLFNMSLMESDENGEYFSIYRNCYPYPGITPPSPTYYRRGMCLLTMGKTGSASTIDGMYRYFVDPATGVPGVTGNLISSFTPYFFGNGFFSSFWQGSSSTFSANGDLIVSTACSGQSLGTQAATGSSPFTPFIMKMTSAATSGDCAGITGSGGFVPGALPTELFNFAFTSSTDYTGGRLWMGIASAPTTMFSSDTPAGSYVAIRLSEVTGGDTQFQCAVSNGTTATLTPMGVTPGTGLLSLNWGEVGFTTAGAFCSINGTSVVVTSNVPTVVLSRVYTNTSETASTAVHLMITGGEAGNAARSF
jgi:hypothetical protein